MLGSVFRMSEEKRPLLWLDVAANVAAQRPDAHFVVCGDGPMRDEMRTYAAELGIADRVHLPGAQSNIGSWFKLMDVVMLTSRHEGLPNVLLEAQSLGVPVVAPDVGGYRRSHRAGVDRMGGPRRRCGDAGRASAVQSDQCRMAPRGRRPGARLRPRAFRHREHAAQKPRCVRYPMTDRQLQETFK